MRCARKRDGISYPDPPEPVLVGECCVCGSEIYSNEPRFLWPGTSDMVCADGAVKEFRIHGKKYLTTCFGACLIEDYMEDEAAKALGMEKKVS